MSYLNGQGLFTSALSGLTGTYSILAKANSSASLSLSDLTNPSSTVMSQLGTNTSFLQYLTNNFSAIDSDGDGKISSTDISKLSQTMQQKGLTYNEIAQLCASGSSGMSSSLTDTVLTYFNQIDKNHDGRVTSQEISEFGINQDKHKMEDKYKSFKASSMSVFYASDAGQDDTSSVLDSLYGINNGTSSAATSST